MVVHQAIGMTMEYLDCSGLAVRGAHDRTGRPVKPFRTSPPMLSNAASNSRTVPVSRPAHHRLGRSRWNSGRTVETRSCWRVELEARGQR